MPPPRTNTNVLPRERVIVKVSKTEDPRSFRVQDAGRSALQRLKRNNPPAVIVEAVARHYDVNANQVFSWRKRYGEDSRPPSDPSAAQLIPVMITAEQDGVTAQPSTVVEKIEINVAGKYRVRVGSGSEGRAKLEKRR
jgi:transposase-like protein